MTDFTSANSLIDGYRRAEKASGWKESNQKYGINLLRHTRELQRELREGTYQQGKGAVFRLCEQGHLRLVKALTVKDTVMQQALCNSVLIPVLGKYLIHDNGASQVNKGLSFTRKRFERHLRWHYRRCGTEGYVLKIDFRKYFDNIRHDVLRKQIARYIQDGTVLRTINAVLHANEVDISFTDDPNYIDGVFNSLEYEKMDKTTRTGKRFMAKAIGIGAPIAQIAGIYLPTPIDTYCKTVRSVHCYDAYMDDRIMIHPSKEFLWELLDEIKDIAKTLGLHGFTFLKTRYILTDKGKIVRRIPRDVVTRQRRKLKKLAQFVVDGELSQKAFQIQYKGWRGDKRRYHARRTLQNMDKLFRGLNQWIRTNRK